MDLNTKDMITKKILDAQEMVRDFEVFSKQIEDEEVASVFKEFAEESGMQARKLKKLANYYRNN